MFLLISGRHVGAHLDGHQHGVSIQRQFVMAALNFIWLGLSSGEMDIKLAVFEVSPTL